MKKHKIMAGQGKKRSSATESDCMGHCNLNTAVKIGGTHPTGSCENCQVEEAITHSKLRKGGVCRFNSKTLMNLPGGVNSKFSLRSPNMQD